MNEQIKRQAEQFFHAAKDARIPENIQAMAEEGVAKSREAYDKLATVAKDQAKVTEEVMLATQAGAKLLSTKVIENVKANTEAAFDAAQSIARAGSVPEAMRLQAEFMQRQFALAGAQTKEFFELSTKVATQTFETVNEATMKSFDKMRKAG